MSSIGTVWLWSGIWKVLASGFVAVSAWEAELQPPPETTR